MNSNKTRVMIVDDNIEFTYLLKSILSRNSDIEIVGVAIDGLDAINKINTFLPDIVIMDIVMPKLDGLGVLEFYYESKVKKPIFIILTAVGLANITYIAISKGAEYVMLKPFDPETLITRIRQLTKLNIHYKKTDNLEKQQKIQELLLSLGVPQNLKGYQYLIHAIDIVFNDFNTINSITKIIYPTVAKAYNTTSIRVEKAIRNTIEITWTRGNLIKIEELFGMNIKIRPSNSEFIIKVLEYIIKENCILV